MKGMDTDELAVFLKTKGWVSSEEHLEIRTLSGGVSNEVWKATGSEFQWVIKMALGKLKVQADWFSDVERLERERDAMMIMAPLLPAGAIPEILHHDETNHVLVMQCAPEGSRNWKDTLLAGEWDAPTAWRAGRCLGQLHEMSRGLSAEQRASLEDLHFFRQLRLDPFHGYVAERHPELRSAIGILIDELVREPECFVHGDYSPKNLLIAPDGQIVVLDFEVAHWGNPVFDVAFCLTHLMLKGISFDRLESSLKCIEAFLDGYGGKVNRLLPHLGLLLLARIDGKSPAGYVPTRLHETIRTWAAGWIKKAEEAKSSFEDDRETLRNKLKEVMQ